MIAYLKKCFNYALAQTKGNHQLCKSQIEQIVPHAFGEPSMCGEWCRFQSDPDNYKHHSLSKNLSGEEMRKDLDTVFMSFSQNSEKIAPGGSTKEIESFNNMDAAKAPKRCHFSASSNLLSRIGCAVAQKNIGNGYVNKINEHLGLSPGRIYLNEAAARDTERKRQRSYSNKKENKLDWLQDSGQVVLVGHNLKVFDFPRLLTALRAVNLETEFQHVCFGGIDSLHVMREIHPGMSCYKQEHLFKWRILST